MQVAEQTTHFFIANDRPTVAGLVLAGSADFKTELANSELFDQRLKAIVLLTVDVSYGGVSCFSVDALRVHAGCEEALMLQPLH